ncbi:MAG: DNA cytosine methyltransferase [Coprothermobacterota bacterium]|nr:DNA cytosine methyltransferase [Coprothermobacterota bacterium]
MKRFTLLSLFAGAGGLDLGLEMAGFETLVTNELEPHACETLRLNKKMCATGDGTLDTFIDTVLKQRCYQQMTKEESAILVKRLQHRSRDKFLQSAEVFEGDIRQIESKQLLEACRLEEKNELFCVAGGPPCQPFSRAGKRQAVDDVKNGDLFFEFVRVVRDLRPRWFVFENVKGLLLTKTEVLTTTCKTCNYSGPIPFRTRIAWGRGEAETFSCPQCGNHDVTVNSQLTRGGSLDIILAEFERIGYRCYHSILNAADFGAPQIRDRLFIVGSRDHLPFTWPAPTHREVTKNGVKPDPQLPLFGPNSTLSNLKPWQTMYDALWSHGHFRYGMLDKRKAVLWVKNVVRPHDEPVTWHLDRPSPTIGAHQGAKLAVAPEGVPEAQLKRQQWHTRGNRQGDTKPVLIIHAYLSDEELLRLQTFPPWWYLHGTRMQRALQIGNAVPPVLARAVGTAIIEGDNEGSPKQ